MKIKKIEIEGFKSYSQKEVVDVLDTQFNAITGLNGSGKSNILDAICFLLGITNLSNVRAHSFADLVFKQGQAGINRATVTITFDNNVPPEQQPSGYNKFREIVVKRQVILNGRNTYHINGVTATNQRVSDLFRMVGINVNNPHFLIMQGRITKVLNMKPLEILSMVEEAAGVRMYECKKQSAIKTIEKKEVKLSEISRLLGEEILPSVEKLKNERENYLEYQRIERELEMFERKLHAYDYFNSHLQVRELAKKADSIKEEIRRMKREYEELEEKVKVEQANLHEMETAKAQEIGPEAKNLEKELKELQKELAKIESEKDGKEASLAELQTAIDRKNKSLKNDQLEMDKKRKQLAQTESDCGNEEQIGKNAEESVVRARQKLEALARGMTTDEEGNAVTLEAQLTATRSKLAERQTNVKKAQMRLEQFTATVGKKKAELHKIARRSIGEEGEKNRLEDEIKGIEHDLQQLNFDPVLEKSLEDERRQLTKESDQLKHQINSIEKDYYNLQFNYENPFNGFDRSKVKERVVRNFKLKDPKFATALEVIGGGRIYNVVVDKAETAKELLAKRCLRNRETFLPMDRIDGHSAINRRQIEEAKKLVGEENVYVPSQLVECAPEMRKIIDFVFGGALICETSEQANVLAYKNTQACRAVSVAGDDFKPSGVLTGGSRPVKVSVLKALYELSGKRDRIVEIEQRLDAVKFEAATMRQIRVRYDEFNNKLVERQKQLDFIKEKLKMSPVEMIRAEIELLEREIADANKIIQTDQPEIEILTKRVKALEVQKKDENYQENEKKKAQKELTAAQKELDKLKSTFANAKEVLASLREEIASLKNSIRDDEEELETMSRLKEEKQTDIDQFNANVQEANEKVNRSQQKMDKFNKEIRQKDKAIRAKMADIEDLKKKMRQLENKQQSKEKDVQECGKTSNEFAKRAQQLEKAHRWISEEKDRFGERDGIYDFQNYNFEVGKREVETRRDRSKELQQTVNTKALKLLDTAELQCQQLEIKHAQLEKDKQRLYDAIEQLNEKKRRELIAAHKQISGDFCGIYSTLLPGASAELLPPNGAENCLAGLEVRVAFNGKYKDSLSELSGGQRSLVALSLILAMLKFKPAPFYILDEIDAALDMSHTENIGKMIKNHFSQSQFIVVSLKQGFFDNANVVYRVQFKDGRSTISRTENKH